MKKFLGLLLAVVLVSCSETEINSADCEKGTVHFKVVQESSSTTSKDVTRGKDIPTYVKDVTITARSNDFAPYVSSDIFNFVSVQANQTQPNTTPFSLNAVAIGSNTFSAVSTSYDSNKKRGFVITNDETTANLIKKVAYVTCVSDNKTVTIGKSSNENVNLTMSTNNGRIIALFNPSQQVSNFKISVRAKIAGQNEITQNLVSNPSGKNIAFEWTDELAVNGAKITFYIDVKSINGTTLYTKTRELEVKKGISLSCVYNIGLSDVTADLSSNGISIKFEELKEETCSTCN